MSGARTFNVPEVRDHSIPQIAHGSTGFLHAHPQLPKLSASDGLLCDFLVSLGPPAVMPRCHPTSIRPTGSGSGVCSSSCDMSSNSTCTLNRHEFPVTEPPGSLIYLDKTRHCATSVLVEIFEECRVLCFGAPHRPSRLCFVSSWIPHCSRWVDIGRGH